jgi:hypothetical protein
VKPLYKKGDTTDFSNYRPISLLTSFSKIIEKIIYKRLYCYLIEKNIFLKEQFGFREKLSTDTATYAFLNKVLSSLDKRYYIGGLFCDLKKAFYCVIHDVLLAKMKFFGITGIAYNLIRSYLNNRYQRISMKDSKFNKLSLTWEHVKHGVTQGSVLGQLLFLIYINYFPLTINKFADSVLFADDTSIIILNTNPEEFKNIINSVMTEITDWFQSNLLTLLNGNKTNFLQFLTKKNKEIKIQIIVSNSVITNINSTKFLGLIIDRTLSWSDQIVALTSKLNKACYAIRAVKSCMSLDVLRTIYFSCVHSVISYDIIFWGNSHFSTNIFKIKKR